jgi:large subunit ribosomal protein L29
MKENADKARALDAAEIAKQLRDSSEQMFRIRFQMSMGQQEGLKKLRSLRKERARMLTVLREREITGTGPVKAEAPSKGGAKAAKKTAAPKASAPKAAAPKTATKKTAKPAKEAKAKG